MRGGIAGGYSNKGNGWLSYGEKFSNKIERKGWDRLWWWYRVRSNRTFWKGRRKLQSWEMGEDNGVVSISMALEGG